MARQLRIEFPGALYHIMSRGDHLERIFWDDKDRQMFLECVDEVREKTDWQWHAYVLMSNHYHFLLETPHANLVAGMKWLQGTYTQRFNARHRTRGHLFQGRYKALLVDEEESVYFQRVSTYIHLNPVRANIIVPGQAKLRDYKWSSFPDYLRPNRQRPEWLRVDRVFGNLRIGVDNVRGRRRYEAYLEGRAMECQSEVTRERLESQWKEIRRGWYLGDTGFKERLILCMGRLWDGRKEASVSGEAVRAWTEERAQRWIQKAMHSMRLDEDALKSLPKGAQEKQVLAWRLQTRTTLRRHWIANRLHMGHETRVTQAVRQVANSKHGCLLKLKKKIESIPC